MWLVTAPYFWRGPALSRTVAPLPSSRAAVPSSAPRVTIPGAADACEQDAVRLGAGGASGLRQRDDRLLGDAGGCARAPAPALDQHEARAEALDAGEILVAGGLVDRPLASEFGLQRHDREAVRLHAAIAAALAHVRVDDDAPVGVLQQAALAPAPLLGRAHLVVDDGRDPLPRAQLALHLVERVAVMDRHAVGELPSEGEIFSGWSVTTAMRPTPSA